MPQVKEKSLTDADFAEDTWFGIGEEVDNTNTSTVVEKVKTTKLTAANPADLEEDDEADDGVTDLDATNEKGKGKTTKKKEEVEEEEEVEPEFTFDLEESQEEKPEKKEVKSTKTEEVEEKPSKTTKTETTEVDDSKFYTQLVKEFKERGVFQNIEVKEDDEVDEDKFFELHDAEIEARANESVEAFGEDLDEDGKAFLRFKMNGGKSSEFMETYLAPAPSFTDVEEFNEDDASLVNKVIRYHVSNVEKLDGEELEERLKYIKDGGKEKVWAAKWFEKAKKEDKERKELVLQTAKARADKVEQDAKEFVTSLANTLKETETVGSFKFTKEDLKELPDYITKKSIKVDKNKYVSPFQVALTKTLRGAKKEDIQNLLVLAKLFKTGFDITPIVNKEVTRVTKIGKSNLKEAKTGVRLKSSGGAGPKSLADIIT